MLAAVGDSQCDGHVTGARAVSLTGQDNVRNVVVSTTAASTGLVPAVRWATRPVAHAGARPTQCTNDVE